MIVAALAADFAHHLYDYLLPHEMAEVVRRNAQETDPGVCHSHDFCDANVAMLDALDDQNIEFDGNDAAQCAAINAAWNTAKDAAFDLVRLEALVMQEAAVARFEALGEEVHATEAVRLSKISGFYFGPFEEILPIEGWIDPAI